MTEELGSREELHTNIMVKQPPYKTVYSYNDGKGTSKLVTNSLPTSKLDLSARGHPFWLTNEKTR